MKDKKTTKKSKLVITFICLDVIAIIGLFLTYGPINYFRNLLVTTAMETQSHHYLAKVFYSDKMIANVLGNNYTENFNNETNPNDIIFSDEDKGQYESIYEEQILKRDKDALYKVIDIEGPSYKGHMIAVYDSKRISFVQSRFINVGGQMLTNMVKDFDASVAINASGFSISNNVLVPVGSVIIDGKVVKADNNSPEIIGFNNDGVLVLTYDKPSEAVKKGMKYGMSFGPFLIVNGKKANMIGNGGSGIAPRTAIAQRKDGIVLLLTIDGRRAGHSLGIDLNEMTDIFVKYKAYNAANLDGGGSSSMVVEGEMINIPGGYGYTGSRFIPNAWIVK
ncbi:MAG: phosphodiester glycosidase family protein [Bacilli bacterium]